MATKKRYYPLRSPANPTKVVLVEITEEQYQAVFPEIWAARKREQRHGRCRCPAEYSWTCNGDCLDCPFHVQGDTTSLEELTEHGDLNLLRGVHPSRILSNLVFKIFDNSIYIFKSYSRQVKNIFL